MQAVQQLAPGTQSLDIDSLADEVAWWTRAVARDPSIGSTEKREIATLFADGLALARAGLLPKSGQRACGGLIRSEHHYLVGEAVSGSAVRRVDPGLSESARRAAVMGLEDARSAQSDAAPGELSEQR